MTTSSRIRPCLHPRANHQHGTYLAFQFDRCRCEPCTLAYRRRAKEIAYRTATGTHSYVPAGPARAHVEQLLQTLTISQVCARSGVNSTVVRVLLGISPNRPASKRITRTTEAALLAVTPDRVGPEEHGLVDGTGTRRRVRALIALGWSRSHLAERLACSSRTIWELTRAPLPDSSPVLVRTRDAVRALYDELSMKVPPPGRATTMARNIAAAAGWSPPLAWDDETIDDPTAVAHDADDTEDADAVVDEIAVDLAVEGTRLALTRAERLAALPRLVARGMSDRAIGTQLGVTERTVERDRRTLGLATRWDHTARHDPTRTHWKAAS